VILILCYRLQSLLIINVCAKGRLIIWYQYSLSQICTKNLLFCSYPRIFVSIRKMYYEHLVTLGDLGEVDCAFVQRTIVLSWQRKNHSYQ
jgi:hypothetical protein